MDACVKPIQIVDLVSGARFRMASRGEPSQCISVLPRVSNPTNKNASIIQQANGFFSKNHGKKKFKTTSYPPFFWAAQLVDAIHPNVPPSPPLGARRNGNGLGVGGSRWDLLSTSTRSLGDENHHHA